MNGALLLLSAACCALRFACSEAVALARRALLSPVAEGAFAAAWSLEESSKLCLAVLVLRVFFFFATAEEMTFGSALPPSFLLPAFRITILDEAVGALSA